MRDIFLNFYFTDHEAATKLAAVFRQNGWTVWKSVSGYEYVYDFNSTEARRRREAKVSVGLWTQKASESLSFRAALQNGGQPPTLHVLLEKVESGVSPWYRSLFDLSDWDGAESHPGLKRLLDRLHTHIGAAQSPPALPASLEDLPPSEIQENARPVVEEATVARQRDEKRFGGVFISYRRNEAAAYAGRLYDRLAARFGKAKVFIDTENVGWGEDFVEAITEAAESCAVMIVLVSRGWSRGEQAEVDDYVRLEVATALGRKIRVIPILIQGAAMPAQKDLPEDLAPLVRRNALALSDTRWERDVEDLIKTLEGLLKD
jgi:hypothetical protein